MGNKCMKMRVEEMWFGDVYRINLKKGHLQAAVNTVMNFEMT
jgi:hypothetical protein